MRGAPGGRASRRIPLLAQLPAHRQRGGALDLAASLSSRLVRSPGRARMSAMAATRRRLTRATSTAAGASRVDPGDELVQEAEPGVLPQIVRHGRHRLAQLVELGDGAVG